MARLCEDWQQELGAIKAGVLSASTAALNLFACRGLEVRQLTEIGMSPALELPVPRTPRVEGARLGTRGVKCFNFHKNKYNK